MIVYPLDDIEVADYIKQSFGDEYYKNTKTKTDLVNNISLTRPCERFISPIKSTLPTGIALRKTIRTPYLDEDEEFDFFVHSDVLFIENVARQLLSI